MSTNIEAVANDAKVGPAGIYLPDIERTPLSQTVIASAGVYAALVGVLAGRGLVTIEEVSAALGSLEDALREHDGMDGSARTVELYRRAIS
jgi:hypothetical protein